MKKNTYYAHVYRRKNGVKEFLLNIFLFISSFPCLILEVFLRKNMGERRYSFGTCIFIAVCLFYYPHCIASVISSMARGFNSMGSGVYGHIDVEDTGFWHVTLKNITWYIFLGFFIYFSLKRRKEIIHQPGVFDFERFSLSTGEINHRFFALTIDKRKIETLIEPGIIFLIGLILVLAQQLLVSRQFDIVV